MLYKRRKHQKTSESQKLKNFSKLERKSRKNRKNGKSEYKNFHTKTMEPTNEHVRYKKLNSWKRIIFANCSISNSTWPKIISKIYQMYIENMHAKNLQNISK